MGHWPLLLALQRYDVLQISGAAIGLGLFLPRPYVVFPTGGDLFISPFEENPFGLLMRAGYRRGKFIFFFGTKYSPFFLRLKLSAPVSFPPLIIYTDGFFTAEKTPGPKKKPKTFGGGPFFFCLCGRFLGVR